MGHHQELKTGRLTMRSRGSSELPSMHAETLPMATTIRPAEDTQSARVTFDNERQQLWKRRRTQVSVSIHFCRPKSSTYMEAGTRHHWEEGLRQVSLEQRSVYGIRNSELTNWWTTRRCREKKLRSVTAHRKGDVYLTDLHHRAVLRCEYAASTDYQPACDTCTQVRTPGLPDPSFPH